MHCEQVQCIHWHELLFSHLRILHFVVVGIFVCVFCFGLWEYFFGSITYIDRMFGSLLALDFLCLSFEPVRK